MLLTDDVVGDARHSLGVVHSDDIFVQTAHTLDPFTRNLGFRDLGFRIRGYKD